MFKKDIISSDEVQINPNRINIYLTATVESLYAVSQSRTDAIRKTKCNVIVLHVKGELLERGEYGILSKMIVGKRRRWDIE